MQIPVKTIEKEEAVSVVVDGFCNHFNFDEEQSIDDSYNPVTGHTQTSKPIYVCQRCGAWREVYEQLWEED